MNTTDDNRLRAAHRLGMLPLMVLAADSSVAQSADRRAAQEAQARLSNNSQLAIVVRSSHFVSFDQPQAIVGAVEQVLASAQTNQPLSR
jgi:pimeloyl-ACP methyl ester carboxylesterase